MENLLILDTYHICYLITCVINVSNLGIYMVCVWKRERMTHMGL